MEKNEIKQTRIGGLGSSDARMVAKIAKNGCLSDAVKQRIAIMLGLDENPEFSTEATEYGNLIEQNVFEILKSKYPNIVSNPYYKSENLSDMYGFGIFNHIDYEIETPKRLIWIENKATKKTFDETFWEYHYQLAWHQMLLNEKSKLINKTPVLMLSHYTVEEYNDVFNPDNFTLKPVHIEIGDSFLHKGFSIISEAIKDFRYEKRESLYADNLPAPLQEKLSGIAECFKRISESEKQIENFKEKMLELMQKGNIKSIQNDFFKILLIGETVSTSFDTKLFQSENPDLAKKYLRQSKRKAFIKINTY